MQPSVQFIYISFKLSESVVLQDHYSFYRCILLAMSRVSAYGSVQQTVSNIYRSNSFTPKPWFPFQNLLDDLQGVFFRCPLSVSWPFFAQNQVLSALLYVETNLGNHAKGFEQRSQLMRLVAF